jgi:phosphoglycolate phosphatase
MGRPLAIVSNNSVAAVTAYLDMHDLHYMTKAIAARSSWDIGLLKPSSHLVDQAVTALNARPEDCTLVGDSPTDIQAAQAANARAIGYANKPGKTESLSSVDPIAITTTMTLLAACAVPGVQPTE